MQEIRCPNCGDVIPIDESAYSRIVLQIRDQEFNQEVQRYKREEAQRHAEELERLEQEYTERLARADELAQMRADEKYRKQLAAQETQLHRMELEAAAQSDKTQLQVQSALLGKREELAKKDITITELSGRLALQESEQTMREQAIRSEYELKLKEKDGNKSLLSGVPMSMPSLIKAYRMQEKAANVGFDWENKEDVWDKVAEELHELRAEFERGDVVAAEAEFGDFIFSLVNAGRLYKLNPDNALELTNKKFYNRFSFVEKCAKEQGKSLREMTLGEMDALWNEAKSKGL